MFGVSEELLQKIATYLATQPFKDVVMLMNELGQVKRIEEPAPADPAVDPPKLVP